MLVGATTLLDGALGVDEDDVPVLTFWQERSYSGVLVKVEPMRPKATFSWLANVLHTISMVQQVLRLTRARSSRCGILHSEPPDIG